MRPHPRPQKHAEGLARARLRLRSGLGWLEGFPLSAEAGAVRWLVVDGSEPQEVRLGRQELSRATNCMQKLIGEFPRALPLIVGDVQRWERRVRALLGLIKTAVHEGDELPGHLLSLSGAFPAETSKAARDLVQARPGLRSLLSALSWMLVTTPERLGPALRTCGRNAATLERVLAGTPGSAGVALAWQLLRIEDLDGPRRSAVLFDVLADPRIDLVPTSGSQADVEALRKQVGKAGRAAQLPLHLPARPGARLGPALRRHLAWLLEQPQTARRRALRLLSILSPEPMLGAWAGFWQELGA